MLYLCSAEIIKAMEYRNLIAFVVSCVGAFSERFGITNGGAYSYLSEYGGVQFLYKHYDIEHTFSIDDVVSDLVEVCRRKGGTLS